MFGAGTSRHRKTIEAREIQGTLEDPLYLQLMVVVVVEHQPIIRDRCARRHATEQSLLEVRHLSPPTPQHQTHCSGPEGRMIMERDR
ncbi:unnamed protein product [Prorocentrum cordatum]|uniref:Uncharacterized protein n=1 Tax=Prorocentrum cordatum TaxID=2364126 RepID=A0ABN9SS52_9DINO|nr:unnamed protein product [Polarella glacialis]